MKPNFMREPPIYAYQSSTIPPSRKKGKASQRSDGLAAVPGLGKMLTILIFLGACFKRKRANLTSGRGHMATFMKSDDSQIYALMRIVAGFLFFCHGCQKILGFPGTPPAGAPAFILYGAGSIELIGGFLIMIGLLTRWAAFICSGEMAVAYWMVHGTKALFPIVNGGELAVLYCFVFLFIAVQGSGLWSVDAAQGRA